MEEGEAAGRWGRGGVEGFNAWMKCFCVVNFDLEYGQSACDSACGRSGSLTGGVGIELDYTVPRTRFGSAERSNM